MYYFSDSSLVTSMTAIFLLYRYTPHASQFQNARISCHLSAGTSRQTLMNNAFEQKQPPRLSGGWNALCIRRSPFPRLSFSALVLLPLDAPLLLFPTQFERTLEQTDCKFTHRQERKMTPSQTSTTVAALWPMTPGHCKLFPLHQSPGGAVFYSCTRS